MTLWRCEDGKMLQNNDHQYKRAGTFDLLNIPFTRNTLRSLETALSLASSKSSPYNFDANETNARSPYTVMQCNGMPGMLLEVRGRLRTHSGEVRCAVRLFWLRVGVLIVILASLVDAFDKV